MSELLLLKESGVCPVCASNVANINLPAECRRCGEMLFKSFHQFEQYERETGVREYWVYFMQDGWKHRTHVLDNDGKPLDKTKALSRKVEVGDMTPVTMTAAEKVKKIKDDVRAKQRWYIDSKKKLKFFAK